MRPTLELRFLNDFQIRYQGVPLDGFDAPRLQSLLAFLILHRDAPQSRKHLAFLLYQDSSEQQAHGNLRSLVHRVKKLLPDIDRFLFADTQTLQWRADAPFTADVIEFQELLATRRAPNVLAPKDALANAVALYQGELLPACYDEWLLTERERLREMYVDALAQLVALAEGEQDYTRAIGYARRLIQADPLGEEAYRKLMNLYALTGDRANVVRVYQTCAAVLKRELDIEPNAATRQLFEELRHQETPAERPIVPRGKPKPNLPIPLTSFVGRTREVREIRGLLERARLVTLTGAGGCGKTRLAIQVAVEAASNLEDGAWFVDLAPLSDAADVARACAAVFGLGEQVGSSPLELIADYVGDKELLLVLDNCEHLLSACAALAPTILYEGRRVRILATSREPLNVSGEALSVVPPLLLPDPTSQTFETIAHSDAVQLFAQRAGYSLPTFALTQENMYAVAQICRRLDGIPLAIELAAARIRTLTAKQIAARLDDALAVLTRGSAGLPARHQTMRAVLDWSDALLGEDERTLFPRLSVFAGGFSLEAAEQVCAEGNAHADESAHAERRGGDDLSILDLVSNLIDKSLVMTVDLEQGDEARYRLLEPVRQYAREKLAASGEQARWGKRHLDWCVELVERTEPELAGSRHAVRFARLERELDNIRAALEFALAGQERSNGLQLAIALERFWLLGGHSMEGRSWLKQLLALEISPDGAVHTAAPIDAAVRARALLVAGALAWRQNDYDEADACAWEARRVWQEMDDRTGVSTALRVLGDVARTRGQYTRAVEVLQQSLAMSRELGDKRGIANVHISLGATLSEQGEYARAKELYQEGLELSHELGDMWLAAVFTNNLGVALRLEDPDQAELLFRQALSLRESLNDRHGMAIALRNLGELALLRQDWSRASSMFIESLGLNQSTRNEKGVAECLVGLAWVENAYGRLARAAQFLGTHERLREMIHAPLPEADRAEYDALVTLLRTGLDPTAFEMAWANGRKLNFEQAVAEALVLPN